ncbi:MAG: HAMP domain-containing histidine kinase [Bacteroidetes bacterium]|nr:HAMP domain-containing histidine kinase [Bacteroidota bacterium]
MKLLAKTTVYFLSAMIALLAVTGFYLYRQFSREIKNRSDAELLTAESQWINYLQSQADIGTTFIMRSKELSVFPTDAPPQPYPVISDAEDYTIISGTKIPYRQLTHVVPVNGINYQLVIKNSQEQKVALMKNFTKVVLFVFAGLCLATLLFNWIMSRRLWRPFHQSLQKIKAADLQQMKDMRFDKTGTYEFNQLNESLDAMSRKIYSDYISMKEFTENAAHEMQTPIAVVQSKLELLLQDGNLHDEQVQSLLQAEDALNRLSRLNQGLLLLAKIENNQFQAEGEVSFAAITSKYLSQFSELIHQKQLQVETEFTNDFKIPLHSFLADSMISNLLGNAIKYNYEGGKITIATTAHSYEVGNTSRQKAIPPDKLYKRFGNSSELAVKSNGLGLAIVKKIADTNNLAIIYEAGNNMHSFTITRKKV